MTPLRIGKRVTASIADVVNEFTNRLAPDAPNHMNIHTTSHAVPGELMYAFGGNIVKALRLRSGMNMHLMTISAGGESHKHSFNSDPNRSACLLLYVGEHSSQLGYTDPRNNEFHYINVERGDSFILSSHHPFHLSNIHNKTPAQYLAVSQPNWDWSSSVTHWQHTW